MKDFIKVVNQSIRLSSALALEQEVNGVSQQTKDGSVVLFPGLMIQNLPAKSKYWLGKLSKTLLKEKAADEECRNDLIKKYGEEQEDKSILVPPMIKDKKGEMIENPNFKAFFKEFNDLRKQVIEIKIPKFDLDDLFCFETKYHYQTAGDLLIQDDDPDFKYEDLEYFEEKVE